MECREPAPLHQCLGFRRVEFSLCRDQSYSPLDSRFRRGAVVGQAWQDLSGETRRPAHLRPRWVVPSLSREPFAVLFDIAATGRPEPLKVLPNSVRSVVDRNARIIFRVLYPTAHVREPFDPLSTALAGFPVFPSTHTLD